MRMHSNIIAATQMTPFIAIAYEHKTRGISRMLGLEGYCLDFGTFTEADLLNLLKGAYQNRASIRTQLQEKLFGIRQAEFARWKHILLTARA
jgi:colanic acid/amylovoran biosynthesis protein